MKGDTCAEALPLQCGEAVKGSTLALTAAGDFPCTPGPVYHPLFERSLATRKHTYEIIIYSKAGFISCSG